jgi:hypothetical protein
MHFIRKNICDENERKMDDFGMVFENLGLHSRHPRPDRGSIL